MTNNDTSCLIEKTKRLRVCGSGPNRKLLKTFQKIGKISAFTVDKLNHILDENLGNDLGGDKYQISKHCEFKKVFNADVNYRQILLQNTLGPQPETVDEYLYDQWISDEGVESLKNELSRSIARVYRARLSEMNKHHALEWHIDTDTSVICRAQLCLKEGGDVFEFRRRGSLQSFKMDVGDLYFVNTGWPHRVVNGNSLRRVAIFGFSFEDVREKEALYL